MTRTVTGTTPTCRSLTEPAHDVVGARIWAGLHFRKSMRDGAQLGHRVARLVI